jgi:hypothetical protein
MGSTSKLCEAEPNVAVAVMVAGPPVSGFIEKVVDDCPPRIVTLDACVVQEESR